MKEPCFAKGIFCIYLSKMENKVIFAVNFKLNSYGYKKNTSGASLSAIHIECQRLTESVHENVHETP